MLLLHCGWPRTGTTSLQTALFERREELTAHGIVYPERWLRGGMPTHHGVAVALRGGRRSVAPLADLRAFLAEHADRTVLVSAEAITGSLLSGGLRDALARSLRELGHTTRVRCVWTLRRFDVVVVSIYLRRLAVGEEIPAPSRHFAELGGAEGILAGMREANEAVGGDVIYARYEPDGSHNDKLLSAFGVPAPLNTAIAEDMRRTPRHERRLSRKQAAALLNLEPLSARAGVRMDGEALRQAFRAGAIQLDDDGPCELVGAAQRASMHERALAAARGAGFAPYLDFFEGARVGGPDRVDLGPDALTDKDLELMVSCCSEVSPGCAQAGESPPAPAPRDG